MKFVGLKFIHINLDYRYEPFKAKRSNIKFHEVPGVAAPSRKVAETRGQEFSHPGKMETKCGLSQARCVR